MKFYLGAASIAAFYYYYCAWALLPAAVSAWVAPTFSTDSRLTAAAAATTTHQQRQQQHRLSAISQPSSSASSSSSSSSSSQAQQHPTSSSGSNNQRPSHHQQQQSSAAAGRILEGGKVIDFGAVKASSRAERALQEARQQILSSSNGGNNNNSGTLLQQPSPHAAAADGGKTMILGINQDVINEVGHELGQLASPAEIQACAAHLRSRAPPGMFQPLEQATLSEAETVNGSAAATTTTAATDVTSTSDADTTIQQRQQQQQQHRRLLHRAYDEAGEVTAAFAKTFYMGTMLLGDDARRAIWAIYVWCRRTDEIVDAPRDDDGEGDSDSAMLRELSAWELRLENLFRHGDVVDVYDLCLLDVRIQYPSLDIQPFLDMIRGMLMDVPDLGQDRYETFDELHLYCYRVAGTVGVMSLPIFGCAPGFDDEVAREPALSLGVAFQLTNILRDVGEDAVQRGRVYLPQEDLKRFGVTERQIREQRLDDNYRAMMKFQIARARMYYERARRGVFMLAPASRLPVQSSLDAYGRILDKIEENDYDSLTKRAYVDKWEKLSIIPFSWYRTTELSQVLPLPGEKPVDLTIA